MGDSFQLSVLTPLVEVYSGEVVTVTASGHDGDFGVLPGHVAYITSVAPGALVIDEAGGKKVFSVGAGFVQVAAERVSVIVSSAEEASGLELSDIQTALTAAENALLDKGPQDADHRDALMDQAMALGRLRAIDALKEAGGAAH
jgi:F-type H+-transporting ATPase subunit epsilon